MDRVNAPSQAGSAARRLVKRLIPRALLPYARGAYARYRTFGIEGVGMVVEDLIDSRKPASRSRQYRGFVLHYSRDNFIIDWVRGGRIWEEKTSDRIVAELTKAATPIFLDVGANIGLMTLNVLAGVPSAWIHAFEPGPDQRRLLERTIAVNRLDTRVTVHPEALGAEVGQKPFVVHAGGYDALDGFLDTGRAAATGSVMVPVQTLDRWWHAAGCPPVSVIKVDTEGAELWVLQGGAGLLDACQPSLFLELQPATLHC